MTPDSPTHSVAPAPLVAGSKSCWIMWFHAACSTTAGQMLPVSRRRRAKTYPNEVAVTMMSTAEIAGDGPAAYNAAQHERHVPEAPDESARENRAGHAGVYEAREHVATPAYLLSGGEHEADDRPDGEGDEHSCREPGVEPGQACYPGGDVGDDPDRHREDERDPDGAQSAQSSEPEGDVREALAQGEARHYRSHDRNEHEQGDRAGLVGVGDEESLYRDRKRQDDGEVDCQSKTRGAPDVGGREWCRCCSHIGDPFSVRDPRIAVRSDLGARRFGTMDYCTPGWTAAPVVLAEGRRIAPRAIQPPPATISAAPATTVGGVLAGPIVDS
jgi:hypothetical protein